MRRFPFAFACVIALALCAVDARADRRVPIYVTIAGQGAIRVRLMSGATSPCDSSDNVTVFDGWLTPGPYMILTPAGNVCLQHTFGASRDGEWSTSIILPTRQRIHAVSRGTKPLDITVSTEEPFS